jgi:hypothetical protein
MLKGWVFSKVNKIPSQQAWLVRPIGLIKERAWIATALGNWCMVANCGRECLLRMNICHQSKLLQGSSKFTISGSAIEIRLECRCLQKYFHI